MITYDESSSHLDGKLMKIQQISKHQSIGMAQVVAVHQLKIADCHGRFAATSSAFQSLWSNIIQYPSVVVKQTTSNNTCTWYLKRFSVLQYISVHDQDLSTTTSRTSHHPSDIATVSTMVPSRGCGMSMRIEVMHVVTSQTAVKIPHAFRIKDYQGRSRSRR